MESNVALLLQPKTKFPLYRRAQAFSYVNQEKKTYNRCLVIALRAPVKVHLTLSQLGGQPLRLRYLNIFEPLVIPRTRTKLNFKEEVEPLALKPQRRETHVIWRKGRGIAGWFN